MSEKSRNETMPLPFNPRSPEVQANPYPTYRYLQKHHPIYYRTDKKDWILTRYADIVEVLKHPNIGRKNPYLGRSEEFLARPPKPIETNNLQAKFWLWRQQSQKIVDAWIIQQDSPDHAKLRQIIQPFFTPLRLQPWRSQIQTKVNILLDRIQERGRMDIINDLAYPLTLGAIGEMLGIPEQAWHRHFKQWSKDISLLGDIDVSAIVQERGWLAIANLADYFKNLIAQYHNSSEMPDNLICNLMQAQAEGKLSEEEVVAHCILLWFGGHSTTQSLIGASILTLLHHPQQLQMLQTDSSLIAMTIAEVLRYSSPSQAVGRTALLDIQIGDRIISKGEIVRCILGAGNRDPAQFSNPDQFNIQRTPNPYLSFGQGIHNCIGKHLGKLVTEIAVGTVVQRFPNLSLATDSIEWEDSFLGRGLKSLPVVF